MCKTVFMMSLLIVASLNCRLATAGSFGDKASNWLVGKLGSTKALAVELTRNKIQFKGCKQRSYALSLIQPFTDTLSIEASVVYGRAELHYGVLNQRITSKSYELITWWKQEALRFGLGSRIRPTHSLDVASQGSLALPQSNMIVMYMELPGVTDKHTFTVALAQESWKAASYDDWRSVRDTQLTLSYDIAF